MEENSSSGSGSGSSGNSPNQGSLFVEKMHYRLEPVEIALHVDKHSHK